MTDPKQPPTPPSGGGPPPPKEPPPPKPPAAQPAPPAKPSPTDPVESLALEALQRKFPDAVREVSYYAGEVNVLLKKEKLVESCRYLKESPELRMDYLSNLCGVDYPDREERFEVVYHLFSTSLNHRINLKVRVAEGEPAPSVTGVWRTANWHEREAFDLLGIPFEGHPDLRRILMGDDFQGHPLRKEYPIRGYDKDHLKLR